MMPRAIVGHVCSYLPGRVRQLSHGQADVWSRLTQRGALLITVALSFVNSVTVSARVQCNIFIPGMDQHLSRISVKVHPRKECASESSEAVARMKRQRFWAAGLSQPCVGRCPSNELFQSKLTVVS